MLVGVIDTYPRYLSICLSYLKSAFFEKDFNKKNPLIDKMSLECNDILLPILCKMRLCQA